MMASGPCNDGSVFPHSVQDVSNQVTDGDYMLKKKDTKGSRAWQQFQNLLVSRRPTRIVLFRVAHCCVFKAYFTKESGLPSTSVSLFNRVISGSVAIQVSGTDPVSILAYTYCVNFVHHAYIKFYVV